MDLPPSTISTVMKVTNVLICLHILGTGITDRVVPMRGESILCVKGMWELILTVRPCVELKVSLIFEITNIAHFIEYFQATIRYINEHYLPELCVT